jgi:hypothetical protein
MSTAIASRLGLAVVALFITGAASADAQIDPRGKPMGTHEGAVERYAVWQDEGGWHIRTTTKEYEHHFRGVIEVRVGEFVQLRGYKLEHRGPQRDLFIEGPEHHVINFDFSTKGSIDGLDFRVKGREPMLSFTLTIGERDPKFEPGRIFIGKMGAHPSSNPFEIPAHGR